MEKIVLVDDLDEKTTQRVARVEFSLDGVDYEIDLRPSKQRELRAIFAPLIEAGRKQPKVPKQAKKPKRAKSTNNGSGPPSSTPEARRRYAQASYDRRELSKSLRDWARENGIPVSDAGRISDQIKEGYAAANSNGDTPPNADSN